MLYSHSAEHSRLKTNKPTKKSAKCELSQTIMMVFSQWYQNEAIGGGFYVFEPYVCQLVFIAKQVQVYEDEHQKSYISFILKDRCFLPIKKKKKFRERNASVFLFL